MTLVSTSPSFGSIGASGTVLVLTFDDVVVLGSGTIRLRELLTQNLVQEFEDVQDHPGVSSVGEVVTLTLDEELSPAVCGYYVETEGVPVVDWLGLVLEGDRTEWFFSARANPSMLRRHLLKMGG